MEERNMIVNILTKTFVVSPYIKATKNPGSFKIIDIDCRNDSQDIIEYFTDIQNMVFSQNKSLHIYYYPIPSLINHIFLTSMDFLYYFS